MKNEVMRSQNDTAVSLFDPARFEVMQRMGAMYAASKLVPTMYQAGAMVKKGKDVQPISKEEAIANCVIALDISFRINASPMMVMQNLAIINGMPRWSSKFLIATVNSCGRFEPLKFKIEKLGRLGNVEYIDYVWNVGYKQDQKKVFDGKNIDNYQCIAYTTKKGSDEVLEGSPVSIRMAVQEGWYTKVGSKWQTMPEQMLKYRAASFWVNTFAPELSMGMQTVEEAQDIIDVTPTAVDVTDEVQKDIEENANKQEIDIPGEPDPGQPEMSEEELLSHTGGSRSESEAQRNTAPEMLRAAASKNAGKAPGKSQDKAPNPYDHGNKMVDKTTGELFDGPSY